MKIQNITLLIIPIHYLLEIHLYIIKIMYQIKKNLIKLHQQRHFLMEKSKSNKNLLIEIVNQLDLIRKIDNPL